MKKPFSEEKIVQKLRTAAGCAFALLFFVPNEMVHGDTKNSYSMLHFFFLTTFFVLLFLMTLTMPVFIEGSGFETGCFLTSEGFVATYYYLYFLVFILVLVFLCLGRKRKRFTAASLLLSVSYMTLWLPMNVFYLSRGIFYWTFKLGFFYNILYLIFYLVVLILSIVRLVNYFRLRSRRKSEIQGSPLDLETDE